MSSNPQSEGTFFVDQAQQPAVPPQPPATPAPAPVATPEPAPAASAPPAIPPADAPTRNVPLGTLIFRAGLLAEEQLEDALQEGMRTGKRLGEVLVERGWLREEDIGRLLAAQKGLQFVELNGAVPDPAALVLIPEEKARLHATLPLHVEGESLVVAIDDPTNGLVLENLRRTLGYDPGLVVAAHGDLLRAIDRAYGAAAPAPAIAEPFVQQAEPAATPPAPPTPMPTVIPPAESRSEEPQQIAPLASAPGAHIPLLAGPEPVQQPAPAQPVLEQPPPAQPAPEQPAPEQPAAEPPAPLAPPAPEQPAAVPPALEQPAAEPPAPLAPPAPEQSAPLAPPTPAPVEAASPAPVLETPVVQPSAPVQAAEPPPAEPVAPMPVEPAAAEPVAPPPVQPVAPLAQEPVQPAPSPQPEVQAPPAEPVANGAQPDAAVTTLHFVVLRLSDGEQMEIGSFGTRDEAQAHAQQVIGQIAAAEGQASWPFFTGRFLRPDTIVSVDLVAESSDKWMGSAARSHWAGAGQ